MTDTSFGPVVPAPELAQVALAACVLELSRSRGAGNFVDRRWTLGEFYPLSLAFLAAANISARWKHGEDPELARFVEALYWALAGTNENFTEVSTRMLRVLERYECEAFTVKHTMYVNKKYYEMMDDLPARRLIRETAKVHGVLITSFAEEVSKAFLNMRVFPSQAEQARYEWQKRQACPV
jgi:hypothetical protein